MIELDSRVRRRVLCTASATKSTSCIRNVRTRARVAVLPDVPFLYAYRVRVSLFRDGLEGLPESERRFAAFSDRPRKRWTAALPPDDLRITSVKYFHWLPVQLVIKCLRNVKCLPNSRWFIEMFHKSISSPFVHLNSVDRRDRTSIPTIQLMTLRAFKTQRIRAVRWNRCLLRRNNVPQNFCHVEICTSF